MKTSDLISRLKKCLEENGDLTVRMVSEVTPDSEESDTATVAGFAVMVFR